MAQGSKWHPLHTALIFGELDKANRVFKSSGNDPKLLSEHNSKGWAALHFASHSGRPDSVEWLLSLAACDPGIRTSRGETALHLAAARGDEAVCNALLKGGCPAEAVTREGRSALHCSAEMGHLPVTRLLVVGAGLSPATPDGGGASAAALAAAGNHKAVLRLLQKSCPGVPLKAHSRNRHRSSDMSSTMAESMGLSHGDRSRRKRERRIGNNRDSVQRVSINADGGGGGGGRGGGRGAAAKGAEEAGHRLLKAARIGDMIAMGEVLARGEVGVEWVGRSNGWTAVMEAAEHGSLEGVCYLVDMGADLERTNKKGLTPLQLAVRSGHLGVAEELLKRGARPNVKTKAGLCLRCLAHSTDHGYLADWLFAMGVADGVHGGCACGGGGTNGSSNGTSSNSGTNHGNSDVISNGKPISRGPSRGPGNGSGGIQRTGSPAEGTSGGAGSGAATTPAEALAAWLRGLKLASYESRLVSQGFDTLEAMGTVTEPDLEAMGFKTGHLRLILKHAPSAALSYASSGGNGPGGGGAVESEPMSPAADPPPRTQAPAIPSPAAANGKSVGDKGRRIAGVGVSWSTTAVDGGHGKERIGEEDEEDEEGMYTNAQALQPMRDLSTNNQDSESGGPNGSGVHGGRGEGFKELKREEVEVDHVIGEGSFGVVRRGRWRGMDVAVKELKVSIACLAAATSSNGSLDSSGLGTVGVGTAAAAASQGDADGDRQRVSSIDGEEEMRHEARMLAKVCNHVCVVQFVGVLLRPVPSVVTRFMENGSVENLLVSTDRPATKELVARMAVEAAKGVIHLHREGVVHRDLASRNLLLDDGFHVRISDFGFSRVKRECASRGYTRSDMGPIKWTSPEAMRKRCYSEASDAFSFGVVLYEMFARRAPWDNHENLDVAFRVCSGERMTVPPEVDEPVSDLMFRCWRASPRDRPDFASILTALAQFSSDLDRDGGDEFIKPPPSEETSAASGDDDNGPAQAGGPRGRASAAERAERAAKAVAAVKAAAAAQAAAAAKQRDDAQSQSSTGSFVSSISSAMNGKSCDGKGDWSGRRDRRGRSGGADADSGAAESGAGTPRQEGGRGRGAGAGTTWMEQWREGRSFPGGRGGGGDGGWWTGGRGRGGGWTGRSFPDGFDGSDNSGGRRSGVRVSFGRFAISDSNGGRGRGDRGDAGSPFFKWRSSRGGRDGGGSGRCAFSRKGFARPTSEGGRASSGEGGRWGAREMPGRGGGQRVGQEGRKHGHEGRADRPP